MNFNNSAALKDFYESPLGRFTCRNLRNKITKFWPEIRKEKILGYGFTLPYLPLFSYGNSCISFMPAKIGAINIEDAVQNVIVGETALPGRNEFFDKVLIVHGLENTEDMEKLLNECWRILKPAGRLIIVAPNDETLWQRMRTPYNGMRGYSRRNLVDYLTYHKFAPKRTTRALSFIPTKYKLLNEITEFVNSNFLRFIHGAVIIEAEKVIFAPGGRPIKIAPSIWDKVLKPKSAAAT